MMFGPIKVVTGRVSLVHAKNAGNAFATRTEVALGKPYAKYGFGCAPVFQSSGSK
jgi:hypothetical protein